MLSLNYSLPGKYLSQVAREPAFVLKKNAKTALLSREEYDKLQAFKNAYWINKIQKSEGEGYIGVSDSIIKLKNAHDQS